MATITCDCSEERLEVRKLRVGLGRCVATVYRWQCQRCGKSQRPNLDPLDLPDGLHPKSVRWAIRRVTKKGANSMSRRRAEHPVPEDQRRRVLERDNYTCQGCGWDDDAQALQIHHARYPDIPEDGSPDCDLQTTCGPCNLAERAERLAGGEGGRVGV